MGIQTLKGNLKEVTLFRQWKGGVCRVKCPNYLPAKKRSEILFHFHGTYYYFTSINLLACLWRKPLTLSHKSSLEIPAAITLY
jgi:hypothetical protein